jgi:hypothetical protein
MPLLVETLIGFNPAARIAHLSRWPKCWLGRWSM